MEKLTEISGQALSLGEMKKNVHAAAMGLNLALSNAKKSQDHPTISKLSVPSSPAKIRSRSNSFASNQGSPVFRKKRMSLKRSSTSYQSNSLFKLQADKSVADVFQTVCMINKDAVTRLNGMLNQCTPKDLLDNKLLRRHVTEASHQLAKMNYQVFQCANEIFADSFVQDRDAIALIMSRCEIAPAYAAHSQQFENDPTQNFLQQMKNSMLISLMLSDQNENGQVFVQKLADTLEQNPDMVFVLRDFYSTTPRSFLIDPSGIDAFPKSEHNSDHSLGMQQRFDQFFEDETTQCGTGVGSVISCPIFTMPERELQKEMHQISKELEEVMNRLDGIPKGDLERKKERDSLILQRQGLYHRDEKLQNQLRATKGEFFNHQSVEDSVCCLVQGSISFGEGNTLIFTPFQVEQGHELIHGIHNLNGENLANEARLLTKEEAQRDTNAEESRTIYDAHISENALNADLNIPNRVGHGGVPFLRLSGDLAAMVVKQEVAQKTDYDTEKPKVGFN